MYEKPQTPPPKIVINYDYVVTNGAFPEEVPIEINEKNREELTNAAFLIGNKYKEMKQKKQSK